MYLKSPRRRRGKNFKLKTCVQDIVVYLKSPRRRREQISVLNKLWLYKTRHQDIVVYLKSPKSNAKSNTKRNTKSNTKGILKRVLKGKLKGFTLRSETIEDLCEKFSTITKNNTVLQKTRTKTTASDPYWRLPSPPIVGEKHVHFLM